MLTCLVLIKHRNIHKDILHISNNNNNNTIISNHATNNLQKDAVINHNVIEMHPQTNIFATYHARLIKLYGNKHGRNDEYLYQIHELNTILKEKTMIKWTYHT